MSRSRSPRCSGTSVLELMIALTIVCAALGIAASLVLAAGRRSLVESERMPEAPVPVVLRQLEIDVTAAASGSGRSDRGEPLKLVRASGLEISYELSGTTLLRRTSDPAGRRPVLDGVRRFGWQWLGGRKPAVLIELAYDRVLPLGPEVEAGSRVFVRRGVESRTFELTLRGAGGVGW